MLQLISNDFYTTYNRDASVLGILPLDNSHYTLAKEHMSVFLQEPPLRMCETQRGLFGLSIMTIVGLPLLLRDIQLGICTFLDFRRKI